MILKTYDVMRAAHLAVVAARQRKKTTVYYEHLYDVLLLLSKELSFALRKGQEYFDFETTDLPF